MNLHDLAVGYAERGWHVHPLRPGEKAPASPKGLHDATDDVDRVSRFWRRRPTANIGLRTGIGFDALDLDGDEGIEAWDAWCQQQQIQLDFLTVPAVGTPSDGLHVYCTVTGAGNRARMLPGVDWRGRGGYVVAPGSQRADGKEWRWLDEWGSSNDPWRTPEQLQNLVVPPQIRPGGIVQAPRMSYTTTRESAIGTRYGLAALDDEVRTVSSAGNGNRNHQLNASGFVLFQLVAGGQLAEGAVAEALLHAAMASGLPEHEARQTIESARIGGLAAPRQPPER